MNPRWSEAADAMLRELAPQQKSAAYIADAINAKLGTSLTRNAVIGRAVRKDIRLTGRRAPPKAAPKQNAPAQAKPTRSIRALPPRQPIAPAPAPIAPALAELAAPADVVIPITGRVTLFDLRGNTCRWPIGHDGEQYLFCGARGANFAAGAPYCAEHAAKSSSRQQAAQSAESNEKRRLAALRRTPAVARAS